MNAETYNLSNVRARDRSHECKILLTSAVLLTYCPNKIQEQMQSQRPAIKNNLFVRLGTKTEEKTA
jgi:hypothetical protein